MPRGGCDVSRGHSPVNSETDIDSGWRWGESPIGGVHSHLDYTQDKRQDTQGGDQKSKQNTQDTEGNISKALS